MIPKYAKFGTHRIKFEWGEEGSNCERIYIDYPNENCQRNLFDIPSSYLFGALPQFTYDNLERSLVNKGEIISGGTDLLDFRMQNGILEVCEAFFLRDNPEDPPTHGITYIDYNNIKFYCEKYAYAYHNKQDIEFYIFCFHCD